MSGEADQLKRKIDEMLASNNRNWVNAVTATVNAMYRQFELERQLTKKIDPSAVYVNSRRHGGVIAKNIRKRVPD